MFYVSKAKQSSTYGHRQSGDGGHIRWGYEYQERTYTYPQPHKMEVTRKNKYSFWMSIAMIIIAVLFVAANLFASPKSKFVSEVTVCNL